MRLYIIKKNNEELYFDGFTSTRVTVQAGPKITAWKYEVGLKWSTVPDKYESIQGLNDLINTAIQYKLQAELDDCELITAEHRLVKIKSSIKLNTIRSRLEQKAMIEILKND